MLEWLAICLCQTLPRFLDNYCFMKFKEKSPHSSVMPLMCFGNFFFFPVLLFSSCHIKWRKHCGCWCLLASLLCLLRYSERCLCPVISCSSSSPVSSQFLSFLLCLLILHLSLQTTHPFDCRLQTKAHVRRRREACKGWKREVQTIKCNYGIDSSAGTASARGNK